MKPVMSKISITASQTWVRRMEPWVFMVFWARRIEAQAGGRDELELGEVEHEVGGLRQDLVENGLELRGGGGIEAAGEGQGHVVAVDGLLNIECHAWVLSSEGARRRPIAQ